MGINIALIEKHLKDFLYEFYPVLYPYSKDPDDLDPLTDLFPELHNLEILHEI